MSRKRDPKRDALVARIEASEAKAGKLLAALKGKFTRYVNHLEALKRLRKQLREYRREPLRVPVHADPSGEGVSQ